MKILGRNIRKVANVTFKVYLVDNIFEKDCHIHKVKQTKMLEEAVYTNGKIVVVSKKSVADSKIEYIFKLYGASWYVSSDEQEVKLVVRKDYNKKIRTKSRYINNVLRHNFEEMKEKILDELDFEEAVDLICEFTDLPYGIVKSFECNVEDLECFVLTLRKLLKQYSNVQCSKLSNLISASHSVRVDMIQTLGLYVPKQYLKNSNKIGEYVYECIKAKTVIKRKDK